MTGLGNLIKRNVKLFFKDKGMFFSALVTPLILLVLYMTFLGNLFNQSFNEMLNSISGGIAVEPSLVKGAVAGQLIASLLSVCCITVAFCSNMLMVQDRVNKSSLDLMMTPVKKSTLALSYYLASLFTTLIICYVAMGAGLVYVATQGWYMSVGDVFLLALDVFIVTMFGTALSSLINTFLKTQGQITAIGTIVSAGYGFICGAYMPISSFSTGLQNALSCFPWTYGTSLIKNHSLNGVFREMTRVGFPPQAVEGMMTSMDCKISFFGSQVSTLAMYLIAVGSVLLFLGLFILANFLKGRKFKKDKIKSNVK